MGARQSGSVIRDDGLRQCDSGQHSAHWRGGMLGVVRTGVRHGLFCLGCCWMLMALLFVGGLMNLVWIGAIAMLGLFEKTLPGGHWMGRFTGLLLIGWGGFTLIRIFEKV